MALNGKYGKDRVPGGNEGYISSALRGGSGPSDGTKSYPVPRPHQTIKTAFPQDNVVCCMPIETSIKDMSWPGGVDNIKHSLTGTSAVNDEVGAAGKLRHILIPDH